MSKDTFKSFARLHPELGNYIVRNNISWQKIYELYEIYGENSSVWDNYLKSNYNNISNSIESIENPLKELFNSMKNIDLDSVQKGVNNLQKTIGLLQDIGIGNNRNIIPSYYESRPIYKYFKD